MSVSRYRDRHAVSGAKPDPGDAKVLADLVRTDRHNHRPAVPDSDLAGAVRVLARAHQSMIWNRRRQASQLRSALREFYPAALAAFDDLTSGEALAVLRAAPEPVLGAGLSKTQIAAAMGASVAALAAVIAEMTRQITVLEKQLAADFEQHPASEVVRSLPGPGTILGARVPGELGDVPDRYATARSRRNYAGTSPVTRASGTRRVVLARHVRNKRLADALRQLTRRIRCPRRRVRRQIQRPQLRHPARQRPDRMRPADPLADHRRRHRRIHPQQLPDPRLERIRHRPFRLPFVLRRPLTGHRGPHRVP